MDRGALVAVCEKLEDDYRPRLIAAGASLVGAWANSTSLGFEVGFGRRAGGMWQTYVKYARRPRPIFSRAVPFRPIAEAEAELRHELDALLMELEAGRRPPKRGFWLGLFESKG